MSATKVPHLIDVTTLGDLLLRAVLSEPDREALIFPDTRFTYQRLWDQAVERARSLHALGIGPGDHVGILMPNCPEFVELLLGASLCGAISVPINARFKAPELAYLVENADLKGLITTDVISEYADFAALLHEALPGLADAPQPDGLRLAEAPLLRFAALFGAPQPGFLSQPAFEAAAAAVTPDTIERLRQRVRVRD
ncbi:MAG: AMP-binding protein, partial [Anaerolineae bacterium]